MPAVCTQRRAISSSPNLAESRLSFSAIPCSSKTTCQVHPATDKPHGPLRLRSHRPQRRPRQSASPNDGPSRLTQTAATMWVLEMAMGTLYQTKQQYVRVLAGFHMAGSLPVTDPETDLRALAPSAAAMEQCQVFSGNDVLSCFPNTTTSVPQHDFASFVCTSPPLMPFPRDRADLPRREQSVTRVHANKSRQHLSLKRNREHLAVAVE